MGARPRVYRNAKHKYAKGSQCIIQCPAAARRFHFDQLFRISTHFVSLACSFIHSRFAVKTAIDFRCIVSRSVQRCHCVLSLQSPLLCCGMADNCVTLADKRYVSGFKLENRSRLVSSFVAAPCKHQTSLSRQIQIGILFFFCLPFFCLLMRRGKSPGF